MLPDHIGRYRVVERIARGAMGAVYAAIDEQLARRVAVTLMLAAFEGDQELCERFHREAKVTAQLTHRRSSISASTTAVRSSSWNCSTVCR